MVKLDKETALKLWEKRFGKETVVPDAFRTYMYKDDYGEYTKGRKLPGRSKIFDYGWIVSYIYPIAAGGHSDETNMEIVHHRHAIPENAQHEPFAYNDKSYRVSARPIALGWGLKCLSNNRFVDWISKHPAAKM